MPSRLARPSQFTTTLTWFVAFTLSMATRLATAAPIVSAPDANGFRWCTVGSAGNQANPGLPPDQFDTSRGRGSVNYDYRIARTEVSTAQWMDFLNAVGEAGLGPVLPGATTPVYWGAVASGVRPNGSTVWTLEPGASNAASRPVGGINWRIAAMYCNWLHNDKATTPDGIGRGAYDASTFGWAPIPEIPTSFVFTDQLTHSPGARFWIPTLDEWLKAAYFDPNKGGAGPGWWTYPNSSDTQPVPGLPGSGDTIAGHSDPAQPQFDEWSIPLEAYPHAESPWGLLDLSGGAEEWLEEVYFQDYPVYRGFAGTRSNVDFYSWNDAIYANLNGSFPTTAATEGLRIASLVPEPSIATLVVFGLASTLRPRRVACLP